MSKSRLKKPSPSKPLRRKPQEQELAELLAGFAELTNRRQRAFLAGIVLGKGIKGARRLTGISIMSHYRWLAKDSLYRELFELARMILADEAEEEAYRRAFLGYDNDKSYSDTLAVFLLKGMKSEVYGRHAADFDSGGPSAIEITIKKEGEEEKDRPPLPEISIPSNEPEDK